MRWVDPPSKQVHYRKASFTEWACVFERSPGRTSVRRMYPQPITRYLRTRDPCGRLGEPCWITTLIILNSIREADTHLPFLLILTRLNCILGPPSIGRPPSSDIYGFRWPHSWRSGPYRPARHCLRVLLRPTSD